MRILSNAIVRYCIEIGKLPCLKEWSPVKVQNSFAEIDNDIDNFQKTHGLQALLLLKTNEKSYHECEIIYHLNNLPCLCYQPERVIPLLRYR